MGRAMVPYLRASDYDSAVTLAVGQVAQVIAADAGVTLTDEPQEAVQPRVHHHSSFGPLIVFILIFLFLRRIQPAAISALRRPFRRRLPRGPLDGQRVWRWWWRGRWWRRGGGGFGGFGGGSFGGGGAGGDW